MECNQHLIIVLKFQGQHLIAYRYIIGEHIHVTVIMILGRTDRHILPIIGIIRISTLLKAPYLKILTVQIRNLNDRNICGFLFGLYKI